MALTDWQKEEIKLVADKYLGKRNQEIAVHTDKLRVDYRIDGQSVYIFEHRKSLQGEGFDDFDVVLASGEFNHYESGENRQF